MDDKCNYKREMDFSCTINIPDRSDREIYPSIIYGMMDHARLWADSRPHIVT